MKMLYNPITGEMKQPPSPSEAVSFEQQGEATTVLKQAQEPPRATVTISPYLPCHVYNEVGAGSRKLHRIA